MTDSEQALSQFLSQEAKKKGLQNKDAKKALKKLKSGGMAQVAPELHSQFMEMNPTMTVAERYRMKMQQLRTGRSSKHSKNMAYDKVRQEMKEREDKEKIEAEEKAKAAEEKKRDRQKRLEELSKRLGTISQELYNRCMTQLMENNYPDPETKQRDIDITDLYAQQQEFRDSIADDDLDELLS